MKKIEPYTFMRWEDLETLFPNCWIMLANPISDKGLKAKEGYFVYKAKDKRKVIAKLSDFMNSHEDFKTHGIYYTGTLEAKLDEVVLL
jgi:hypothetical protein